MDFLEHQKFQKRLNAFINKEGFRLRNLDVGYDSYGHYSIQFIEVK